MCDIPEDLLPWVWAVEDQLKLYDQFDAMLIRETSEGNFEAHIDQFKNVYNLNQYVTGHVLQNRASVFCEICAEFFGAPPQNLHNAQEVWTNAVNALRKRLEIEHEDWTRNLWSALAKAYWFHQPNDVPMYDRFAASGLRIEVLALRGRARLRPRLEAANFLEYFDEFYTYTVKQSINNAIDFVDRKYPYPIRVADKYLWLRGNENQQNILDNFRAGVTGAPYIKKEPMGDNQISKTGRTPTQIDRTPGDAKGRCRTVCAGEFVWTVATAARQGKTVSEQTQATLAQLETNLLEAGSGKERIVEAVIYLTDMGKKAEMDAVWCDWIPADGWPNRACVGTALAPGDLVEIKVTALKQG